MIHRLVLVLVGVLALVGAVASSAQIVTVPPGLAPGARYRLVFVTSTTRNGASANAADYNAFVTSAANAVPALAALGTTWKAVAETVALSAQDNTGTNPQLVGGIPTNPGFPFYRLDGAKVANDNAYFWSMLFPLATISLTETGGAAPVTTRQPDGSTQAWVWTGVTPASSKMGSSAPVVGVTSPGGANAWIGLAISGSANAHPLYAVSGILQVPAATPAPIPPGAAIGTLVGSLAVGGAWLSRRAGRSRREPAGKS